MNYEVRSARRVMREGREYLVAPATLIVSGVLAGSKGRLYYPPSEVNRSTESWNQIPITVYHPQDPVTGLHLSANDDGVIDRQGVGFIEGSKSIKKGDYGRGTRGNLWFDVEKTRKVNRQVLSNLEAGIPLELSTGLFTDNEEHGGQWRGREYDYVARNYRPDHLAILPDQVGACSLNDGCGVFNRSREETLIVNGGPGSGRHKEIGREAKGEEEEEEKGSKFIPELHVKSVVDIIEKVGGSSNLVDMTEIRRTLGSLTREQQDKVIMHGLSTGRLSGASREGRGGITKEQRSADFPMKGEQYGLGYLMVRNSYQEYLEQDRSMTNNKYFIKNQPRHQEKGQFLPTKGNGLKQTTRAAEEGRGVQPVQDDEVEGEEEMQVPLSPTLVKPKKIADPAMRRKIDSMRSATVNGNFQRTSNMTREQKISILTVNCNCEEDKAAFNQFSEETLDSLLLNRKHDKKDDKLESNKDFTSDAERKAAFAAMAGDDDFWSDKDDETDNTKKTGNQKTSPMNLPVKDGGIQSGGEEEEESETGEGLAPIGEEPPKKKAVSMNQLLQRATKEDREVWNNAVEINRRAKVQLIRKLVANAQNNSIRKRAESIYNRMDISELKQLVAALPPVANRFGHSSSHEGDNLEVANYLGSSGGPAYNSDRDSAKEDILDVPTINYSELSKEQTNQGRRHNLV